MWIVDSKSASLITRAVDLWLKEQVDLARANPWKVKMARYNDDNDDNDDDDRNIYLRNEYL